MTSTRATRRIEGYRSETSSVNGIRLHHWTGGDPDGQPVILMHGFLSTGYGWRHVAPALATVGMSVLVPDMRGYGDSDKPKGTAGYDARALAEEARALADQLGFGAGRPIILAAHDMGAMPALLWAADHPDEIEGLLYIEAPVMLGEVLCKILAYTPDATEKGAMWWWALPLAPGVVERLIVGNERGFVSWFYETKTAKPGAFDADAIEEYLRTFSGTEGVLGSLGVYRAAFTSIAQTEPLMENKVAVPIVGLGGDKALGNKVGEMVGMVADKVTTYVFPDCGHFLPEECPDAVVTHVLAMASRAARAPR